MNKNIWIIVTVVILLILGIAAYFIFANKPATQSQTPTQTPLAIGTNPASVTPGASSLKDLLASGVSQQCTYSDTSGSNTSQGTVYVSSGKMRVDFTTSENTQNVSGHMISDAQYFYTWTDGASQGFKMAISSQPSSSPSANNQALDVNKQINYNCSASAPDPSLFNLPTGVQFSDINSLLPPQAQTSVKPSSPASSGSGAANSAQCNACDSVPAASRAACRQALGCQ